MTYERSCELAFLSVNSSTWLMVPMAVSVGSVHGFHLIFHGAHWKEGRAHGHGIVRGHRNAHWHTTAVL